MINNIELSTELVSGYITRGMRAFASYIREVALEEFIETYLSSKFEKVEMKRVSWIEDMNSKTDLKFILDGEVYRIWTYQSTGYGLKLTTKRVMKKVDYGYNIMLPFNMYDKTDNYKGWRLYDNNIIAQALNILLNKKVMSYDELKNKIVKNKQYLNKACIFYKDLEVA